MRRAAPALSRLVGMAAALLLTGNHACAAEETEVEIHALVLTPQGWVPPKDIVEGTEIFYTVAIHNPTSGALREVVVTRPIPANTRYVGGSAVGPAATVSFSMDGGQTFGKPAELRIRDRRGRLVPVSPDRYTHIRWALRYPLAAGATAYARFRAIFQ